MGANTQTTDQTTSQQQKTTGQQNVTTGGTQQQGPYAPTVPYLNNILSQMQNLPTSITPSQSTALAGFQSQANTVPGFGSLAAGAIPSFFNTGSTQPQIGMLGQANADLQARLSPYFGQNYTDPLTTPGLGDTLGATQRDITNSIAGMWSGAGRPLSTAGGGASNAAGNYALARGLAAGMGPLETAQYNALAAQQQGAINQAFGGESQAAQQQAMLGQIPLSNVLSGIQGAGAIPGLWTAPGATALTGANVGAQLPWEMLQPYMTNLTDLARLGATGTTTGTLAGTTAGTMTGTGQGTSTTTQPINPLSTALGLGLGIAGLGMPGGGSVGGSLLSMIPGLSDERLKEDIHPIGMLFNGLPFYRYRFKDDDTTRTGVMAQDVEKVIPDAVHNIGLWNGGPTVKVVDYARATDPTAMAA